MRVLLEFWAAFACVAVLIIMLAPLARRVGLVDRPGGRKRHAHPTPVIGGLAIALGTMIPALFLSSVGMPIIGLGVAATILLVVGVVDDIYDIRWYWRILAQVAAAFCIIFIGGVKVQYIGPAFGLGQAALGELAIPFTVLATVGLINALNMADGVDGLAGSMVFCTLVMLVGAAVYAGNGELTNGLVVMAGAVAGFLAFNLRFPGRKRAEVFLGNSGSAYLGLVIAWAVFRLTQNPGHPVSPVLAPFLIAPPVIDCLVLMARRLLQGRSPFWADRTHMHHIMMEGGFSVTGVVMTLSAISLTLGLTAGLALIADVRQPLMVLAYLGLTGAYFAWSARPEAAARGLRRLTGAVAPPPAPTPAKTKASAAEGTASDN